MAAKTQAERSCWDFVAENKPQFKLITINPSLVIGPWLSGYARPNESSMIVKERLLGKSLILTLAHDQTIHDINWYLSQARL